MKNALRICKCHGISGSCITRTCWKTMDQFRIVGNYLKHKYDSSILMTINQAGNKLITLNENWKKPNKNDLIYLDSSLDFCEHDTNSGKMIFHS